MSHLTFKKFLTEYKPIFRYVYHITNTNTLDKIKKQGLIPSDKSTSKEWEHIKYNKPSIFVFTRNTTEVKNELLGMIANKYGNTSEYTDDQWNHFLDTHVMLTIDLAKCKNVDLSNDPNIAKYQHSVILSGTVPPDSIISIDPINFDWS